MLDQAPRVLNALLDMAVEEGHLDVVLALTILSKMIIQVNILVIFLFLFLCLLLSPYSLVPSCLLKDIKVLFRFNVAFYLQSFYQSHFLLNQIPSRALAVFQFIFVI